MRKGEADKREPQGAWKMGEKPILFIWDFHGVLEKGNELAVLEVTNTVLGEYGYDVRASHEDIMKMYGLRWQEYFRLLITAVDGPTVEEMVARCVALGQSAAARHCKPRDHALETLKTIFDEGHSNVIVSNTSQGGLEFFIDLVGVRPFIERAHGIGGFTSLGKAEIINEYYKREGHRKLVVIGDTENDIEAGLSTGATTYYVDSRGQAGHTKAHHSILDLRDVLRELDP